MVMTTFPFGSLRHASFYCCKVGIANVARLLEPIGLDAFAEANNSTVEEEPRG